jgi:anaerobic dimethyl sulfoxide reductase subunit C
MKKLSLILFTILSQAAVGAFFIIMIFRLFSVPEGMNELISLALTITSVIMVFSLIIALGHLGSPLIAFRAIFNIRSSWLSREVFLGSLFAVLCLVYTYLRQNLIGPGTLQTGTALVAGITGFLFIYAMGKLYMLKTVSWWNSALTPLSFFLSALILGGLVVNFSFLIEISENRELLPPGFFDIFTSITGGLMLLLCFEFLIVPTRMIRLLSGSNFQKGQLQNFLNRFRWIYYLRLFLAITGFIWLGIMLLTKNFNFGFYIVPFGLVIFTELLGRYLFYAEQETSAL